MHFWTLHFPFLDSTFFFFWTPRVGWTPRLLYSAIQNRSPSTDKMSPFD